MVVLKWIAVIAGSLVAVIALVALVGLVRLSRNQPATDTIARGVVEGRLKPCPETPNCVSTQVEPSDEIHYVEPIEIDDGENALEQIESWIHDSPRAEIVTRRNDYIHAVFRSRVFGFADDFEVYVPASGDVAHLRSASRVGQGDMGVNRARYEDVRAVLRSGE